jgi:hypothetical protein
MILVVIHHRQNPLESVSTRLDSILSCQQTFDPRSENNGQEDQVGISCNDIASQSQH